MQEFFRETPLPKVDRETFIGKLTKALGSAACLRVADNDLVVYESDGLTAYRQKPWVVALPETVDQVSQILRVSRDCGVPVVPRGAGTGLSGGALPHPKGLLLSTARLTQLEINPDSATAKVGPGVRNLAVSEAAAAHDLFYAPDPSSQIACSIGGNIAENSGGVHCLKYGLTVHNVLQVELMTMDGDIISIGGETADCIGGNCLSLVLGSEGMLGIVVAATLKLLPKPAVVRVLMAGFDSVIDAGSAVADIIGAGVIPAGLEMMDQLAIAAAEDFANAGYPRDAQALLLCELDGDRHSVDAEQQVVLDLLTKRGASTIETAEDLVQRNRLWLGRKSAFPAVGRISPDYYCMDGTIPRRFLADVLEYIAERGRHWNLGVANVFHAGDGNLHPLILFDANKPDELDKAEKLGAEILERSVSLGGTITGEHGVGVEKINQMCIQFSAAELAQFDALRAAFDATGLLNPGKAIPTLNRCAEFGAMHVHSADDDSNLPRF